MVIGIVSLDNSEKIKVGGKHIHQALLKNGLEQMGHDVFNFFPDRTIYYLAIRVLYKFATKLHFADSALAFAWSLNYLCKNLSKKISKFSKELDVVFTQDPVSAVAASNALKVSKTKILLTLHGYLSLESVNYGNFSSKEKTGVIAAARIFEKKAIEVCHKIISVDTRIANYMKTEFKCEKNITILKNAINPDLFNRLDKAQKDVIKNQLNIPTQNQIFLIPRRLVRKNGVDVAIRALSILRSEGVQNISFIIMGDGPEFETLKKLSYDLKLSAPELIFIGSIQYQEATRYYDLADVILVPSILSDGVEEATSLSMLEGMAAKKIVIVSNIGGMKEVILNGSNGFLFEQNNPEELSALIQKILGLEIDIKNAIVEKAYTDVCEKHHYLKHSQIYLSQVYSE